MTKADLVATRDYVSLALTALVDDPHLLMWAVDATLTITAILGGYPLAQQLAQQWIGCPLADLLAWVEGMRTDVCNQLMVANQRALCGESSTTVWHSTEHQTAHFLTRPLRDGIAIVGAVTITRDLDHNADYAFQHGLEQQVMPQTISRLQTNAQLAQEIDFRVNAEQKAQHDRNVANTLREITLDLNNSLDLAVVLNLILDNLGRVIPHDAASIMLVDDRQARIVGSRDYRVHGNGGDNHHRPQQYSQQYSQRYSFEITSVPIFAYMMEHDMPLVLSRTAESPLWQPCINGSGMWIKSYIGTPIRHNASLIGFLNIDSLEPNFFSQDQAEIVLAFAAAAATAIHNAQALERSKQLAILDERQHLARELHDAVSQTLFSASMIADSILISSESVPASAQDGLRNLQLLIRGAWAEMRMLLMELLPTALAQADLFQLVRNLVDATRAQKRTLRIGTTLATTPPLLSSTTKIALYRLIQEALNNAVKHAAANEIAVSITYASQLLEIRITDNGVGFDPAQVTGDHLGLSIMRERAHDLGATIEIASTVQAGTTIKVKLRLDEQSDQ